MHGVNIAAPRVVRLPAGEKWKSFFTGLVFVLVSAPMVAVLLVFGGIFAGFDPDPVITNVITGVVGGVLLFGWAAVGTKVRIEARDGGIDVHRRIGPRRTIRLSDVLRAEHIVVESFDEDLQPALEPRLMLRLRSGAEEFVVESARWNRAELDGFFEGLGIEVVDIAEPVKIADLRAMGTRPFR